MVPGSPFLVCCMDAQGIPDKDSAPGHRSPTLDLCGTPWTDVSPFLLLPLLYNTALEKSADDVSAQEPLTRQLSIRKIREMKLGDRQPARAPSEQ